MKSHIRYSKASGSTRRRVDDIIKKRGRYSPSREAKRMEIRTLRKEAFYE